MWFILDFFSDFFFFFFFFLGGGGIKFCKMLMQFLGGSNWNACESLREGKGCQKQPKSCSCSFVCNRGDTLMCQDKLRTRKLGQAHVIYGRPLWASPYFLGKRTQYLLFKKGTTAMNQEQLMLTRLWYVCIKVWKFLLCFFRFVKEKTLGDK